MRSGRIWQIDRAVCVIRSNREDTLKHYQELQLADIFSVAMENKKSQLSVLLGRNMGTYLLTYLLT